MEWWGVGYKDVPTSPLIQDEKKVHIAYSHVAHNMYQYNYVQEKKYFNIWHVISPL